MDPKSSQVIELIESKNDCDKGMFKAHLRVFIRDNKRLIIVYLVYLHRYLR
jgi:hypothetical protein